MVNVDPSGEAVIAGRAAPNAKVELRDGGKTVAEATADAAGQFVIIPPALAPGDHSLSLAANGDKAAAGDIQPGRGLGSRAGSQGGAPRRARLKRRPPWPPPRRRTPMPSRLHWGCGPWRRLAACSGARVAIQSVEAEAAGGLVAKGSAEPNTALRLYLNGATSPTPRRKPTAAGRLTIKGGMTPGGYVMQRRRDQSERRDRRRERQHPVRLPGLRRPLRLRDRRRGSASARAIVRALAR